MRAAVTRGAFVATALALCAGCRQSSGVVLAQSTPVPPDSQTVGPIAGGPQRTSSENPLAGNPEALALGRRLFVHFNCSGCHGGHAGGGMGPSLRDPDWIYGSDPAHVFDSIAKGRARGMPAWGTRLPAEQIWQLTAYIGSLRSSSEPERPQ
jgi:cytochrome c oxidase cbb3-type subunit 3